MFKIKSYSFVHLYELNDDLEYDPLFEANTLRDIVFDDDVLFKIDTCECCPDIRIQFATLAPFITHNQAIIETDITNLEGFEHVSSVDEFDLLLEQMLLEEMFEEHSQN